MSYLQTLLECDKTDLVNDLYNRQVAEWADYEPTETDPHGHGKRIPYIGWFWRAANFVNKRIPLGDSGEFVGVMVSNKWGYPDRMMTEQEADTFIAYLERAFAEANKGGVVAETRAKANAVFEELWQWFQTLTVPAEGE